MKNKKYYSLEPIRKHKLLHFNFRKREVIWNIWLNVELDHSIGSYKKFTGNENQCKKYAKEHNINFKEVMIIGK